MDRMWLAVFLAGTVAAAWAGGCAQQNRSHGSSGSRAYATGAPVRIDPRADRALHRMSATLSNARSFSFHSVTTMDEPAETGQLVQFTRHNQVIVHRPDAILVNTTMEGDDVWTLWYHGTDLTLLDKAGDAYASMRVPDRIDGMLDTVAREKGLTVPLADLLVSNPYDTLTTGVLTGEYIGRLAIDGVQTDHLLFTSDALDWQVWIDATNKPVPLKIVIDYKRLPGRPQFVAVLNDWNLSASVNPQQFQPVLPAGARQVDLTTLLGYAKEE